MTKDYLDRIQDAFLAHCGRGLVLSPRDRSIVERWARADIPVNVVISGLNDAFATPPRRRVTSIAYAAAAIEKSAAAWRNRAVGSGRDLEDHAAGRHPPGCRLS